MTYGKRACKDMVKDTCNDMWSMLVRKHRRMSSNDMMGTDLQLHEGNIHEMTWLGHTASKLWWLSCHFDAWSATDGFCNRLTCKRLQNKGGGRPASDLHGRPHPGGELAEDCHVASVRSSQ